MAKQSSCCCEGSSDAKKGNPDHRAELHRVNRIAGQLDGVRKMIEAGHYCPDILVQTKAIAAAIRSLEAAILERHLTNCVQDAFSKGAEAERTKKVEELVKVFRER